MRNGCENAVRNSWTQKSYGYTQSLCPQLDGTQKRDDEQNRKSPLKTKKPRKYGANSNTPNIVIDELNYHIFYQKSIKKSIDF